MRPCSILLVVLLLGCKPDATSPSVDTGSAWDVGVAVDAAVAGDDAASGVERDAGAADGAADPVDAGAPDVAAPGPDAGAFKVERLRTGTTTSNGRAIEWQLLRLEVPGKEPAYAQWMPVAAPDGGVAPVLFSTKPYEGIGWTGDPRDERWASLGTGLHPDVDGPGGGPDAGVISYVLVTPEAQCDEAFLYQLHGISMLQVFGRYYAGGSIQNDVDDMVAGFEFLAREPGVDRERIGILGGSWGGFEALYGAAWAPESVRPVVGVALYPLSDFAAEVAYVTRTLPARYQTAAARERSEAFFDPYLRRMTATTGGLPDAGGDFTGFDLASLAPRLRTQFLVIHEDEDTLVDIGQSERLLAARPDLVQPLWLRHDAPPASWDALVTTHGKLLDAFGAKAAFTFAWSHLLRALTPGPVVYVPYETGPFGQLLVWCRDRTRAGTPHHELAPLLVSLTDPRVVMYELGTQQQEPGAAFVARVVNTVWGTQLTAETVGAALAKGLPE